MKKRFLPALLALVLCVGLCAAPASAYSEAVVGQAPKISASGYMSSAVIHADGSLWMWGGNLYGQLGNGTTQNSAVPIKVMDNVATVCCNDMNTFAVKTDGTLWGWGWNYDDVLGKGVGNLTVTGNKCQTKPVKIMDNVAYVSAYDTIAVIKTDGSLWMWGNNSHGQFGNGTMINSSVPIKVMDNVATVCTGSTTAAIKTDGSLWMWGLNLWGALGNNGAGNAKDELGYTCQTTPIKVMDNVTAVSTDISTVALKGDGTLWVWGTNLRGQLGIGDENENTKILTPTILMEDVYAISGGTNIYAAIKRDGSLWTWGENTLGQLGNGLVWNAVEKLNQWWTYQTYPLKIMDDVAAVSCGGSWAVAVKTDGSVWSWGNNTSGRAGHSNMIVTHGNPPTDTPCQTVPAQIPSLFVSLSSIPSLNPAPAFTDVPSWCSAAVDWAVGGKITEGTAGGKFSPDTPCTHAMIITFLWRAAGKPIVTGGAPIQLTGDEYYADAVRWAAQSGLLTPAFQPDAYCTRASAMNYIWSAFHRPIVAGPAISFTDVTHSSVPGGDYNAIQWAVANGIAEGTGGGNFSPDKVCNRGTIVTLLHRAYVPSVRLK